MFEIKLNVEKITVITGNGPDKVIFHTELPDGCWPFTGKQTLECQCASDTGVAYVQEHFKRNPDEIINVRVSR